MAEKEKLKDYSIIKTMKPPASTLNKFGIVGCGSMGQDIALLVSKNGIDVVFVEISDEKVKEAFSELNRKLDAMINRWGLTSSEKRAVLSRLKGNTDFTILKNCGIVIECISSHGYERSVFNIKKEIFRKIESVVSPDAIIATNSSTIVISELASVLEHPERAVGIHFLSPANTVRIIEVERSLKTSDEAFEKVKKFARTIDKKVITVNESPGNISTRLIIPLINEACEILMEGVATIEEIDETMRFGFGMQLGPFELADKSGLDKLDTWMDNLYEEFGDIRFKPSPLIKRLVRAGHLGRISGEGFYKYNNGKKVVPKKPVL
jgi:3-hydroxybutyryl-CoA dehydrogenase